MASPALAPSASKVRAVCLADWKDKCLKAIAEKRSKAEEYGRLKKEAMAQAQWWERQLKAATQREMSLKKNRALKVIPSQPSSSSAPSAVPLRPQSPKTPTSSDRCNSNGKLSHSFARRATPIVGKCFKSRPTLQASGDKVLLEQKTYQKRPTGVCLACWYRDNRKAGGPPHTCSAIERTRAQEARKRKFASEKKACSAKKLRASERRSSH